MRIGITSVLVDDQEKALKFYTEVLGFVKKTDIPAGEFKWLTVVSPEEPDGVELLLEPDENPAARVYKQAIHAQGIPVTQFYVDDLESEYKRLRELDVYFAMEPTDMGPVKVAILDDTCGNLIQLVENLTT